MAGKGPGIPAFEKVATLIDELQNRLDESEKQVIRPILGINKSITDLALSRCEEHRDFLICKIFSADKTRCPFEFHFGRNEHIHRFDFYLGLGAEWYNYESFRDDSERIEIAEDIERFLESTVHCERHITKSGVAREFYSPSKFVVDGMQIRFAYKAAYRWPFFKFKKEVFDYRPWLEPGFQE